VPKLSNTIVYLIGVPAVGKYTTAKALAALTGAKVVDNQLINLPVFFLVGYDGTDQFPFPKQGARAIEKIRSAILTFIRDHPDPAASFVFTNVLESSADDKRLFRKIELIAKKRGALFVPVWLKCSASEIRKRKRSPDRRQRLKDTDLSNIKFWTEEFQELEAQHPNALTLDTSHHGPAETARLILRHIEQVKLLTNRQT
jgi:shikimate kinase